MADEISSRVEVAGLSTIMDIKIEKLRRRENNAKSGLQFCWIILQKNIWKIQAYIIEKLKYNSQPFSDYFPNAPDSNLTPSNSFLNRASEIWLNSSNMMKIQATNENIQFYHFFQPNMYDPRLKNKYVPYNKNNDYRWCVPLIEKGYPLFSNKIKNKKFSYIIDCVNFSSGVNDKSIWSDDACHLTDHGNWLIWQFILSKIRIDDIISGK